MVQGAGYRVPRREAEAARQRLLDLGVLRMDLTVARDGDDVLFPLVEGCGPMIATEPWDFEARTVRPKDYQSLLPEKLRATAPRAFDQLGDILIVKVPDGYPEEPLGQAMLAFHNARAVFADGGVKGPYRVRALRRIAGTGNSLTQVQENGVKLWVDPGRAYFSPRLAGERARIASLIQPGERVVDLFGGVAPMGIQAALRGATVTSVDINADACNLAQRNVDENGVTKLVKIVEGDAAVAAAALRADRLIMNLPHGGKEFLHLVATILPNGTLHYHEILPAERLQERRLELAKMWQGATCTFRTVRQYSPQEVHAAFDVTIPS